MTLNEMSDVEKKALSEMNRILNTHLNNVLMPRAMTQEMSDVEKKALSEMNRILNTHLNNVLMPRARTYGKGATIEVPGGFDDPDGDPVVWILKRGRHPYNFYEGSDKTRYGFSPWKDSKGWYWAFNFRAIYNKATGRLVNYVFEKPVRFRKRKLAKARAEKRVLASS